MALWNYILFKQIKSSPHRRVNNISNPIQRASLCTCLKGSYTLEAAIVIPLVAAYLVTFLFFFSVLEIQCSIDEALLYAGRKTAVESSIVDSEELLLVSAEAYMVQALQDNALVEEYVQYGIGGIYLGVSQFNGEEIILRAQYMVKLPLPLWGIKTIACSSQNYFRKWVGDNPQEEEEVVYVTLYGEVYHRELSCPSLNLSVKEITLKEIANLRGKNGQCYYECEQCWGEKNNEERVFYTDYGTRYHKDVSCSGIKRLIEKIALEEIGDRRPCKFCCEE